MGVVLFAVFVSLFVCWKLVVFFIVSSIPNCFDDPDLCWSDICCMLMGESVHIYVNLDPDQQQVFLSRKIFKNYTFYKPFC